MDFHQEQQIKTFKDFLTFYNVLSETCFARCVSNLNSRSLDEDEAKCIDRCATKFITCNNRLIKIYAVLQEKIVAKKLKVMEEENLKQQQAIEAAQVSADASVVQPDS